MKKNRENYFEILDADGDKVGEANISSSSSVCSDSEVPINYDVKVIMVGNSGSGKSSVLRRLSSDEHLPKLGCTVGIDIVFQTLKINNDKVKAKIWDTAGADRFRAIVNSYYKEAKIILVCYDVSDQNSINSISKWIKDARDLCGEDAIIYVAGLKYDLMETIPSDDTENDLLIHKNSAELIMKSVRLDLEPKISFPHRNKVKYIGICSSKSDTFVNKNLNLYSPYGIQEMFRQIIIDAFPSLKIIDDLKVMDEKNDNNKNDNRFIDSLDVPKVVGKFKSVKNRLCNIL